MEPVDTAFLPLPAGIVLESVYPTETVIVVQIACRDHCAACPRCEQPSERVHGHYTRTVADLPCGGRRILLRNDPERIARYIQVQDASTERRYVLRVPPTIQTAAEAVAWTFQVGVEDYRPAQET